MDFSPFSPLRQVSTDSEIEIVSDSAPQILRKPKKKKARASLFTAAQIEGFKRQGSKDDPISLDIVDS